MDTSLDLYSGDVMIAADGDDDDDDEFNLAIAS